MKNYFIIILILLSLGSQAQKKFKFGKVDISDLKMEKCEFYPEAKSMILMEVGDLGFIYDDDNGFRYQFTITKRIKIFDDTDKDLANISIQIYDPKSGGSQEQLGTLRAFTHNLENGKVEKVKLKSNEKHSTRLSDWRVEYSFAMPDVKKGSVLELKYTITSDFISNLRTWTFQNEIPTAYSEFKYSIPEYYKYSINQVGNVFHLTWDKNNRTEKIVEGLETACQLTKVFGENIPPVENEPYMNNKKNLPSRIEFQLQSIQYPNRPIEIIAGSYPQYNKNLMESSYFGKMLEKGNFAKNFVASIAGDPDLVKATKIQQWIDKNTQYNGSTGAIRTDKNGNQVFKDDASNAADINLSFVCAMKEAGLNAHPVVLSTRGHGILHPTYPNDDEINYVVAAVEIDGKLYFGDAASDLPFGYLPQRCMNGKGWMVTPSGGKWVNLKNTGKRQSTTMITFSVDQEIISATIERKAKHNLGFQYNQQLKRDGEETFADGLKEDFPEWSIENFQYDNGKKGLEASYSFELNRELIDEDLIYLNPVLLGAINENPFQREKRFSPIDFPCPQDYNTVVNIKIPEGYVAEIPEPILINLPEKGGSFLFNIVQNGNIINIVSRFQLKQLDFLPSEYPSLKQFFELMAEKNNQMIVLKKKT